MTHVPDPDEAEITPQAFMDGCARSALWLGGAVLFLFILGRITGHSEHRLGILSIGFAVVLFAWAGGRPPFVTILRYHSGLRQFGPWRKGDYIGEAYMIVLGLVLLAFGLYQLL